MSEPERPLESALVSRHGHGQCSQDRWLVWLKASQPWTPAVPSEPTPLSLTHNWKHRGASQQISRRKHTGREQCPEMLRRGAYLHRASLCNVSPVEGCCSPKAFESPYKGSLCGLLKLILSESPEANSVQLDYHSLPLDSAVSQCPSLNEFTVLTGICWQSLIPDMKWAAFSLCLAYWETHRHLE